LLDIGCARKLGMMVINNLSIKNQSIRNGWNSRTEFDFIYL